MKAAAGAFLAITIGFAAPPLARAQDATFEAVAKEASPANDLSMLVAASMQDCAKGRRAIDKSRCRGIKSFLGERLAGRRYVKVVDESLVVGASTYDAAVRGYRVRLLGCLTCQEPTAGPAGDKLWVTLKAPVKGADSLVHAVELARPAISFPNAEEAKTWLEQVKPKLRAEFVFSIRGEEWTFKRWRGVAFEPVASRVFNRCTGEVLFSEPPSQARAAILGGDGCDDASASATAPAAPAPTSAVAGSRLDSVTINHVVATARGDFEACDRQFKHKGTAYLAFVVTGAGGSPQKISVQGKLSGTAVAQCLIDAAMKVKFPAFGGQTQRFQYPIMLTSD